MKNRDVNYDKMPRKNKGLWIPRELLYTTKLKLSERVILAEIDVLDCTSKGCYATNRHFFERFGLSKKQVSIIINRLAEKGLITSTVLKKKGANGGYERSIRIVPETCEKLLTEHLTPIPEKGDRLSAKTVIAPIPEKGDKEYKTKTNLINTSNNTGENYCKSSRQVLDLDLKIVNARKDFFEALNKIFRLSPASAHTFALIAKHITEQCQEGTLSPEIFEDAIRWAKMAKRTTAKNKIGLFCKKLVEKTGYKKTVQLL